MNRDPRVDELLAPLRDGAPEWERADPPERVPIDRDKVIARMMAAATIAPVEQTDRKRWFAGLAVAAVLAVAIGAVGVRKALTTTVASPAHLTITAIAGEVTVQGARRLDIAAGISARVAAGGDLTTAPQGEARIELDGLELQVFGGTRVALAELEAPASALRLVAGKVRCRVPRLSPAQSFSVVTSDLRVVVHGTDFSVEIPPSGAPAGTTVHVDEGVVAVQHASGEITLAAPQSWTSPSIAEPPAAAPPSHDLAPPTAAPATAKHGSDATAREPPPSRKPPSPAAPSPGTLDEETRLLRSGLAAERKGDFAGAAGSLELLLSRYPQSPLGPDARRALARVRKRQGPAP
jgi:ferric-dicitrate binding protein FerR (iron transport regulator)